jgi:hypothetical protein
VVFGTIRIALSRIIYLNPTVEAIRDSLSTIDESNGTEANPGERLPV